MVFKNLFTQSSFTTKFTFFAISKLNGVTSGRASDEKVTTECHMYGEDEIAR